MVALFRPHSEQAPLPPVILSATPRSPPVILRRPRDEESGGDGWSFANIAAHFPHRPITFPETPTYHQILHPVQNDIAALPLPPPPIPPPLHLISSPPASISSPLHPHFVTPAKAGAHGGVVWRMVSAIAQSSTPANPRRLTRLPADSAVPTGPLFPDIVVNFLSCFEEHAARRL